VPVERNPARLALFAYQHLDRHRIIDGQRVRAEHDAADDGVRTSPRACEVSTLAFNA